MKEMKESNEKLKWEEREPFAYWKGNPNVSYSRERLLKCNLTRPNLSSVHLYSVVRNQPWLYIAIIFFFLVWKLMVVFNCFRIGRRSRAESLSTPTLQTNAPTGWSINIVFIKKKLRFCFSHFGHQQIILT